MPLLDVDRLTTAFPIEGRVVSAVSGVSFSLDAGETLALVGESGCGKSLTALSLLRLVEPPGRVVGGTVLLDGRDLLSLPERDMRRVRGKDIGLVLQEPMTALNPVHNIEKQIIEVLATHFPHMRPEQRRQKCLELLAEVGLPDPELKLRAFPHHLSGGMRQRVMIAIALMVIPSGKSAAKSIQLQPMQ